MEPSCPPSNTSVAPIYLECMCSVGPNCSLHGHYSGRNCTTFTLNEDIVQASQGGDRSIIDDTPHAERTDNHSFHPFKCRYPQQPEFLAQDVVSAPRPELMSARHPANGAPRRDNHPGTRPIAGDHDPRENFNRTISWDVQDHHGYINIKVDSQTTSQSPQPHVDPRYQHGGYDEMFKATSFSGGPGSNYFPPLPFLGNQSLNNGGTIVEQGAYDGWSNTEHDVVDALGTICNPQIPHDVLHGQDSAAIQLIANHNMALRTVHQTFPHNGATTLTSQSMAIGDQLQETMKPSAPMLDQPAHSHTHLASTSLPMQTSNKVLHSPHSPRGTECPWRDETGRTCGVWVISARAATHLANHHGIKNIPSHREIKCQACHPIKLMKRESILRHYVEVHIKITRKPCKKKGKKVANGQNIRLPLAY